MLLDILMIWTFLWAIDQLAHYISKTLIVRPVTVFALCSLAVKYY